jgi:hypothetical protein
VTVESSLVYLLRADGQSVEGALLDAITEQQMVDWEDHWIPARNANKVRLKTAGVDRALWPQSNHWDWRQKASAFIGNLATPGFSVVCEGMTQGMMFLDTLPSARLQSQAGKPMVYVSYLEVAPWNRRDVPGDVQRFRPVGAILMRAAIAYSREQGFKGRIGLHSLPQSNDWYANKCGMADLGMDAGCQNLRYFEMTPEIADAFERKGSPP